VLLGPGTAPTGESARDCQMSASLVVIGAAHKVAALFANEFATAFCEALAADWTVKHRFFARLAGWVRRFIRVAFTFFCAHPSSSFNIGPRGNLRLIAKDIFSEVIWLFSVIASLLPRAIARTP
jgi:hypothetical protein